VRVFARGYERPRAAKPCCQLLPVLTLLGMPTARYLAARPYAHSDRPEWLRMRQALWPNPDPDAQLADMDEWLATPGTTVIVVPRVGGGGGVGADAGNCGYAGTSGGAGAGRLAGFAEIGTRSVAESCSTSPVAFLEGWYVYPDLRRQGVGTALVRAAEAWARSQGFEEFASDTQLANTDSQRAHAAVGFIEVERLVAYRKVL
jgi:aminoglycoside 6'-N-acetyltransferase I